MSTPPVAAPLEPVSQPSQPGLSEPARIINAFISPRKTFEDVKRNASWWVPLLLLTLSAIAFLYTVEKKIGYEAVINNRFAHASFLQRAIAQMPPEQKQAMIDRQIAGSRWNLVTTPIINTVIVLIFAAILMATFNFGFDAGVKYKTALAVLCYGWLPKIAFGVLAIVIMMVGVDPEGFDMENPVATHLGVFLGSNTDQRYLYHLLAGVDIFSFWWVFLVGLGFATVSQRKVGTGTAVAAVSGWYIIFTLLRVALSPLAG
jgi:hypothetical protein